MKNFKGIIEKVRAMPPFTVCVAMAEDAELLAALKLAEDLGFIRCLLTGDAGELNRLARQSGLSKFEVIDCSGPEDAAAKAVEAVRGGRADILMKGLLNTSIYMRAVLNREKGLRSDRLLSLLAVYELPEYHKLIFGTDSGINTAPDLAQKQDILVNALLALRGLGLDRPKVAALAANEMVDPKIQATVDAAALAKLAEDGQLPPCVLEGPLAFDVAFDARAAAHKGIASKVAGDVDLLLFPNIEAGNMLGKSWLRFNRAKWAGIVLGAARPVILGSRSDTAEIKVNSIALGCLASRSC